MIFPLPVFRKRFAVALWVFNLNFLLVFFLGILNCSFEFECFEAYHSDKKTMNYSAPENGLLKKQHSTDGSLKTHP